MHIWDWKPAHTYTFEPNSVCIRIHCVCVCVHVYVERKQLCDEKTKWQKMFALAGRKQIEFGEYFAFILSDDWKH